VLVAGVPGQREAHRQVGVLRKVVRSQTAHREMNGATVGIALVVRLGQRAAAPPPGARRAGHDLVPHFETNREAAPTAPRVALPRGEAHRLERRRRPRGVARGGTRSQYQAVGVRSLPRIDRIVSLGTARHIGRRRVGTSLGAGVQGQVDRRVREQAGCLRAIGDRSRASRAPRVRGHSPIAFLVVPPFGAAMTPRSRVAMMTD
jgi:hypothetical protein